MSAYKKRKASEDSEGLTANSIVSACITFGEEGDMISSAIDATKEVLEAESMQVGYFNISTFVRNEGGFRLAEQFDKIEPLKSEVANLHQMVDTVQRANRELTERLNNLESGNRFSLKVRHRFISTTKRDVLMTATEADYDFIRAGNAAAHHGDAELDSLLYRSGARNDVDAYEFLYGIHPSGISTMLSKFLFSSV